MTAETVQEALWSVLADAVEVAQASGATFTVVGGWSPLLLNSSPIPHPGTRDVDLLFENGEQLSALEKVCKALLTRGFVPSAKHPFQVLRVLKVASVELAFNVDLLHPSGDPNPPKLFVDQMDLEVLISSEATQNLRLMSVATPVSAFIFDGHITHVERQIKTITGTTRSFRIPVMDELGLLVTKSQSVKVAKRERDALDICFAIAQCRDLPQLSRDASELQVSNPVAFDCLCDLGQQIANVNSRFNRSLTSTPIAASWRESIEAFCNLFLKEGPQHP